MNRRQFGLRVLGLVGGVIAAFRVPSAQAITLKNVGKTPVAFTTGPDTPLLRDLRDRFNGLMRGTGSRRMPHTIHLSPRLFRQFRAEMGYIQDSLNPALRFTPVGDIQYFKCATVYEYSGLDPLRFSMTSGSGSHEDPSRLSTFTYRG